MKKIKIWIVLFLSIICMQNMMAQEIILPKPKLNGDLSVESALLHRRSIRHFSSDSLALSEVGQLCWAALGITDGRKRTNPSAGAIYPIQLFVQVNRVSVVTSGIYRYHPEQHTLMLMQSGDFGSRLRQASYNQSMLETAALNLILAGDYLKIQEVYGDRGIRYLDMEAGHIGQSIYLQCESLNLGTVAVGAFDEQKISDLLQVPETIVYIFPAGKPMQKK